MYPVGEGKLETAEIGSTPLANEAAVIDPGSTLDAVKRSVLHAVPVHTNKVLVVVRNLICPTCAPVTPESVLTGSMPNASPAANSSRTFCARSSRTTF